MLTRNVFAVALAAGLLALSTTAPAAALTESDFGPIEPISAVGFYPAIASGPADGTSLVVFTVDDGDNGDIYGQFVDTELALIGAPFLISNDADSDTNEPATAEWNDERQEWLVVWESFETDLSVIAGRIVQPGVGAVGTQFTIADSHAGSDFRDIELAYSAYAADQDVYLVVFKAEVTVGQSSSCQAGFGVFVNSDGTVPTTVATILSVVDATACDEQINNGANVDYSPASSRWLVGWGYGIGEAGTVLVENVAGVVTVAAGPILVGAQDNQVHPSIDHDSTRDRFLVAWHSSTGGEAQIIGALVDNAGAQVGTEFEVTPEDARGGQRAPRMVYDAAADLFLAVNHNTDSALSDGLPFVGYWELAGATGASAAAPEVLSDPLVASERPDITVAGDCVLVVWQNRPDPDEDPIGVQGRSSCFTPELAATGPADVGGMVALAGLLAIAGAGALAVRRARAVTS